MRQTPTVMARDAESHRVIQETLRQVNSILVPDAAFLLPHQPRRRPAQRAIGWLARNDHEGIGYTPPQDVHVYDWAARSFYGPRDFPFSYGLLRMAGVSTRMRNAGLSGRLEEASNGIARVLYERVSAEMLRAGNKDFDRAEVLVSDRFHAHILAILRHQPVVLLADAFGKNRSSYETWTHRFPNVHLAQRRRSATGRPRAVRRRQVNGAVV